MDLPLQFKRQLFISDIKSIDINHIKGPFFPDYQSLSPCRTLQSHLTLNMIKGNQIRMYLKHIMNLSLFLKIS